MSSLKGFEVAGTVKIRGFDTFVRCKPREGGYCVSYGRTLKFSGRRRLYGFTYVTLKDISSVIRNQWGDRIQILKDFVLLRDSEIYMGPIRRVRKFAVRGF